MKKVYEITSENNLLAAAFYSNNFNSSQPIVMILTGDGKNGTLSSTWNPVIDGLLSLGLSIFTFDFLSQGNSSGLRSSLTLSSGIINFQDAFSLLNREFNLSNRKLGFLGSSFGATVLLNSKNVLNKADAIALKSPAFLLYEAYENEHGGIAGINKWQKDKISKINELAFHAYKDSFFYSSYQNIISTECPIIIIHGTNDSIVPISQSRRINLLLNNRCKLIELDNVDHDYKQNNAINNLVKELKIFFNESLLEQK